MIRINQMKLNIEHTSDDFEHKILKTLCIKKEELQGFQIRKQSIDARKKPVLYYVYSVDVQVRDEAKVKKTVKNNQIQFQVKPDSLMIRSVESSVPLMPLELLTIPQTAVNSAVAIPTAIRI